MIVAFTRSSFALDGDKHVSRVRAACDADAGDVFAIVVHQDASPDQNVEGGFCSVIVIGPPLWEQDEYVSAAVEWLCPLIKQRVQFAFDPGPIFPRLEPARRAARRDEEPIRAGWGR